MKKLLVKEDEVKREAKVEHRAPEERERDPESAGRQSTAEKSACVSGVSQKRNSSTFAVRASVALKLPKIQEPKKTFVATAMYRVTQSYQDNAGKKFAVLQGELVKFIRYCEEETKKGSNYVLVMNKFEKTGIIPEVALDTNAVPRVCPCRNVAFFKEKAYLNHQVLDHYYWPLYNYLMEAVLILDGSQQLIASGLACPVEDCQETFPTINSLMVHYGGLPHARVLVVQQLKNNWIPIFRMLDRMEKVKEQESNEQNQEGLRIVKKMLEVEKEKVTDYHYKLAESEKKAKELEEKFTKLQENSVKGQDLENNFLDVKNVKHERDRLEAEMADQVSDYWELIKLKQLQALEKERVSLANQNEGLRKELVSVRNDLNFKNAQLDDLKNHEELRSKEKKETEEKLIKVNENLQQFLDCYKKEKEDVEERFRKKNTEIEAVRGKMEDLEEKLKKKERECNEREEAEGEMVKQMKHLLQEREKEISEEVEDQE